eukprot:scaffold433_cov257-Pinguiococcus_pyrenoidosus.AAC.5
MGDWPTPATRNYFRNSRGQRIHFRYYLPEGQPKSLLFVFHGLTSHCNTPIFDTFAERLGASGVVLVSLDFHGHGYSEGERCLIWDGAHLDEEAFSVVALFAGPRALAPAEYNLEEPLSHDAEQLRRLSLLPYALAGGSMGAGAAMNVGLKIRSLSR